MPIGSNISRQKKSEEKSSEPKSLIKPLKWIKPTFDNPGGKNIGLIGEAMTGKTLLGLLFGYMNSKYKSDIRDAGFENVVKLLDRGLVPEVEHIVVLEPENKLLQNIKDGPEKALLRPFVEEGIIEIIPAWIPRKEVELTEKGVTIKQRRDIFEAYKDQFDSAVRKIVDSFGPETLFIIDSMSKYYRLLQDKFGLLYDVLNKRENPTQQGIDTYRQSYYASRNSWWDPLMEYKEKYSGWNIDIYKEKPIPKHYQKAGEDPFNIKWVPGTMHNLSQAYRVLKVSDKERYIELYGGRYEPSNPEDRRFPYLLDSKMGAMPILENMAEKLLYGEAV